MAIGEYQIARIPLQSGGINLRMDPKMLPPGQWQSMLNVVSEFDGTISPRRGRKFLGNLPAGANEPFLIEKLITGNVSTPGIGETPGIPSISPRYIGEKSDIYRSATLATGSFAHVNPYPVCTPPSLSQFSRMWSMEDYGSGSTGSPWGYIAGELAMFKDYGFNPIGASANIPIANVTGPNFPYFAVNSSPLIVTTRVPHPFKTGDTVMVYGCVGAGQILGAGTAQYFSGNGIFTNITVLDSTRIQLNGVIGNITYQNSGIISGGLMRWGILPAFGVAQVTELAVATTSTGIPAVYPATSTPLVITTNVPHGIVDYMPVTIRGTSVPTLNGTWYAQVSGYAPTEFAIYTNSDLTGPVIAPVKGTGGVFIGRLDGGPSSTTISSKYSYVYTYRNPLTGFEGNPSRYMLAGSGAGGGPKGQNLRPDGTWPGAPIEAIQRSVVVTVWGTDDPQIPVGAADTIAVYRAGGTWADGLYRFIGYTVNAGKGVASTIYDNNADLDLEFSTILETDNDPPVTSTLPRPYITTATTLTGSVVAKTPPLPHPNIDLSNFGGWHSSISPTNLDAQSSGLAGPLPYKAGPFSNEAPGVVFGPNDYTTEVPGGRYQNTAATTYPTPIDTGAFGADVPMSDDDIISFEFEIADPNQIDSVALALYTDAKSYWVMFWDFGTGGFNTYAPGGPFTVVADQTVRVTIRRGQFYEKWTPSSSWIITKAAFSVCWKTPAPGVSTDSLQSVSFSALEVTTARYLAGTGLGIYSTTLTDIVLRDPPPAVLVPRIGSLAHIRGTIGLFNAEDCVIQDIYQDPKTLRWHMVLYLQFPHIPGDIIEIDAVVGQPCNMCCTAFDSMFVAGDPNNPHTIYQSKVGETESFPIVDASGAPHQISVSSPANPIMGITEFRGHVIALTQQNIFEIPVFQGAMYSPNVTPAQRGLIAYKGYCQAETEIWYISYDGIWVWNGGASTKASEALDPIFHGQQITVLGATYEPIDLSPTGLQYIRMEYSRKQIHFIYRNFPLGHIQELVFDALNQRWEPAEKTVPELPAPIPGYCTDLMLERDTGNLLYMRRTNSASVGGFVCLDDLVTGANEVADEYVTNPSTEGFPIQWNATTGWMDLGSSFTPKVFDEILIECDPQGISGSNSFTVDVYYDYQTTPQDRFEIKANALGRAWRSLETNLLQDAGFGLRLTSYGRQASVVAFSFAGNTKGPRPYIYALQFRYREVGTITSGPVYDWSDLGHPWEKHLYEFTIEFDTGNLAQNLILDTVSGIRGNEEADNVQIFQITNPIILGPGRAKAVLPVKDGVYCKLARLRAQTTNATQDGAKVVAASNFFRLLDVQFKCENYPPDITLFCEPEDGGYTYLKYANQISFDVDTNNVPIQVQLQAEGATSETITIKTGRNDRIRNITLNPNLVGRKWRWYVDPTQTNIANGTGKFQVFSHAFRFQKADKGEVGHTFDWDDLGHPFDKFLTNVTMEYEDDGLSNLPGQPDVIGTPTTLQLDILGGTDGQTISSNVDEFTLSGLSGRCKQTFPLPVDTIAKMIRLYPNANLPQSYRQWKYTFSTWHPYDLKAAEEPPDTILWTPWNNCGYPYEKAARNLIFDVDTNGVPATVVLEGNGRVALQTLTIQTTYTQRHLNIALNPNLIANLFRLVITPGPNGRFKLWNWVVDYIALPAAVKLVDTLETDFGTERWKWLKEAWIHYSATAPITFTVLVEDGVTFFSTTLPIQPTRDFFRFFFPAVTTALNKSRTYRFQFTSAQPFYLFADTRIDWSIWNSDQMQSFRGFNVTPEQQQPTAQPVLG